MDEKDKRIAELEAALNKQIAINASLSELNKQLLACIAELERCLGLDSSNSSKPPSSDGLGKKPKNPQEKPFSRSLRSKGKNPSGGQKGHAGKTLEQVDNPDSIVFHSLVFAPIIIPIYAIFRLLAQRIGKFLTFPRLQFMLPNTRLRLKFAHTAGNRQQLRFQLALMLQFSMATTLKLLLFT